MRFDVEQTVETQRVEIKVQNVDDPEEDPSGATVIIKGEPPCCAWGGPDHDWRRPPAVVGGTPEHPGVADDGHGETTQTEVCRRAATTSPW